MRPETIRDAVLRGEDILDQTARAMAAGESMPLGPYHPLEADAREGESEADAAMVEIAAAASNDAGKEA